MLHELSNRELKVLCHVSSFPHEVIFLVNSGSEANDLAIHVPVELQRYYPGRALDARPISIRLSLHKTGALNL